MQISRKFVPIVPIANKVASVYKMAWWLTGDKPLPDSAMCFMLCHMIATNAYHSLMDNK